MQKIILMRSKFGSWNVLLQDILTIIEDLIERKNVSTMAEFAKSVNAFLESRQYKIFKDNE